MQDCKDGSGLQFIKFDFKTGGQEIKLAVLVNFCPYFVPFVHISLCLPTFSSYFKIIKQAFNELLAM